MKLKIRVSLLYTNDQGITYYIQRSEGTPVSFIASCPFGRGTSEESWSDALSKMMSKVTASLPGVDVTFDV